jgi:hypothetical protein
LFQQRTTHRSLRLLRPQHRLWSIWLLLALGQALQQMVLKVVLVVLVV